MTSAPKSDITVAAAGPAIKLAQSITFKPSKTRSTILLLQAECAAVAHDTASGPASEMRTDDQDRGIGKVGQHALARQTRLSSITVRRRRPFRPGDLTGMVHKVAGNQRFLATRGDAYADVAGSVPESRNEANFLA